MVMTTDMKTRRKAAAEPMTFEQIAERKLREKMTAYRDIVARAASGEQLPEADMEAAVELLSFLGLPSFAFRRDVVAKADHDAASRAEAEARVQRAANDKRLTEVTERLKALEAEVVSLKAERHRLGDMADHSLVGFMSRQRQLEVEHPHVLAPLEDAVRFRLEQQHKRQGVTLPGGIR